MKDETLRKYFPHAEQITVSLPATLIKDDDTYCISITDEAEALIGQSAYSQGRTREEAEKDLWAMIKAIHQHHEERSRELDLWKPFQKGNWGHIGGSWFTVFGIHVYFRYGKNMKGGWYLPFTKMNISVGNYWRIYRKHERNRQKKTTEDKQSS